MGLIQENTQKNQGDKGVPTPQELMAKKDHLVELTSGILALVVAANNKVTPGSEVKEVIDAAEAKVVTPKGPGLGT